MAVNASRRQHVLGLGNFALPRLSGCGRDQRSPATGKDMKRPRRAISNRNSSAIAMGIELPNYSSVHFTVFLCYIVWGSMLPSGMNEENSVHNVATHRTLNLAKFIIGEPFPGKGFDGSD